MLRRLLLLLAILLAIPACSREAAPPTTVTSLQHPLQHSRAMSRACLPRPWRRSH